MPLSHTLFCAVIVAACACGETKWILSGDHFRQLEENTVRVDKHMCSGTELTLPTHRRVYVNQASGDAGQVALDAGLDRDPTRRSCQVTLRCEPAGRRDACLLFFSVDEFNPVCPGSSLTIVHSEKIKNGFPPGQQSLICSESRPPSEEDGMTNEQWPCVLKSNYGMFISDSFTLTYNFGKCVGKGLNHEAERRGSPVTLTYYPYDLNGQPVAEVGPVAIRRGSLVLAVIVFLLVALSRDIWLRMCRSLRLHLSTRLGRTWVGKGGKPKV